MTPPQLPHHPNKLPLDIKTPEPLNIKTPNHYKLTLIILSYDQFIKDKHNLVRTIEILSRL